VVFISGYTTQESMFDYYVEPAGLMIKHFFKASDKKIQNYEGNE
jgi:hypothetical protein